MKFKKQIKKIVCCILIVLVSFILGPIKGVYSSGTLEDPIILEPSDGQYIELRAIRIKEIEEDNYQILMQLWAHGLETTAFTFRIGYDKTVMQPSNLEDNTYIEDVMDDQSYFSFENGLENNMDILSFYETRSVLLFETSLLPSEEMLADNPYIIEKEGIGKVLDSTTQDVLVGTLSFRSTSNNISEDAIQLVTSEEERPKTGIKIMANQFDYYENQKAFKFTLDLVSTNAKLKDLTTNLAEVTDFDRNKYDYTIQVNATEKEITVFPIPEDEKATVTIAGEVVDISSGMVVPLEDMTGTSNITVIEILVTAEDGETTQTYTLNVEKQGGFLEGTIITANVYGIYNSTIKVYKSDQYIDWKNTNSTELDEYELIAQTDTLDDGTFQVVLPIGKYDVLIDKPGYLDYIIKGIEITQKNTYSIGNIQIIPGDINKDRKSKYFG